MRADCSTTESTGEGIEAGIEESAVVALVLFHAAEDARCGVLASS